MDKQYILRCLDKQGNEWLFEGMVEGKPIFTEDGIPMKLTRQEAYEIQKEHGLSNEQYILEEVK